MNIFTHSYNFSFITSHQLEVKYTKKNKEKFNNLRYDFK